MKETQYKITHWFYIQSSKPGKPVFGVINQDSGDSLGVMIERGTNRAPKAQKNMKGAFS